MRAVVLTCLLLCTSVWAQAPSGAPRLAPARAPAPGPSVAAFSGEPVGFIRVQGTRFVDEQCREFLPTGWNSWVDPLVLEAVDALNGDKSKAAELESIFSQAANNSFNTMRLFLTGPSEKFPLQTSPGQYNETLFKGFDYILDLGRRYNVKLILAATNNWQINDGPASFTKWANTNIDSFWSNPTARTLFKNHLTTIANRVNTVNGRQYKNDPTIFAWNLYNEMRCPQAQNATASEVEQCLRDTNAWISEMSSFLKQQDPNHLITVGNEGFFGPNSQYVGDNPFGTPGNVGQGWSALIGQDFVSQHNHTNIDFASFHLWPDNWNSTGGNALEWVTRWMRSHQDAARALNKPLVLSEFGKRSFPDLNSQITVRDPYFNLVYNITESSIVNGDTLRGALFWFWDPLNQIIFGQDKDPLVPIPPSGNVVQNNGSTYQIVRRHSDRVDDLAGTPVLGCTTAGVVAGK